MHFELVVVLLFAIATGVALVARWLKLPYTAALVVAGLVIGAGHWVPAPHMSKDLLFTVFLPGLLFEAAFHLDAKHFWSNRLAICGLAGLRERLAEYAGMGARFAKWRAVIALGEGLPDLAR